MELILKETIDTLGPEGAIVDVKPGYGRNYLLPQGKAVIATKNALKERDKNMAAIQARIDTERGTAEVLAKKLSGLELTITVRAGDDGRLYGSVTTVEIAAYLEELGIKVDKRKIVVDGMIKALGSYNAQYKAGYQVTAEFTLNIVSVDAKPEEEEVAEPETAEETEETAVVEETAAE
jgi:large subunit ribosomal protein L9